MNKQILWGVAMWAVAGAAMAQAQTYEFDKVHSQLHASVSHLGFSNSTARFHIKDGSLSFNAEDWTQSKVDVEIDAASIDLGDATWKDHLSGAKWFDLAGFPTMRFVSTKVEKVGDKGLKISGDLTLKGVTKPVVLNATLNGAGPHPFSKKPAVGFSATTSFKRSDFGMAEYVPMVGDEVSVRIEIEASAAAAN